MIKRNIKYCLAALVLLLSSCDKWLTVEPEYQVIDKDLYGRPTGFQIALNGIYINLSSSSLYGRNLSWGEVEAWARRYNLTTGSHDTAIDLRDLNYDNKGAKGFAESIWSNGYNVIAQTNDLLNNLSQKSPDFFSRGEAEYSMIKGEALAIRAMMHFDIARIFADAPAINDEGKLWIPYVTQYPSTFNPPITLKALLENVVTDLEQAQQLVYKFDMGTITDSTNLFAPDFRIQEKASDFYGNRGARLNYLAVTTLLARVHLYAGNYEDAAKYANVIVGYITAKKLKFPSSGMLASQPLSKDDLLFAFYNNKLVETYNKTIDETKPATSLHLADNDLYSGVSNEKRLAFWSQILGSSPARYVINRYYNAAEGNFINNLIPNIRLSEAYYIAAEVLAHDNKMTEAAALLTTMRKTRGPSTAVKSTQVEETLIQEYRKEFVGEGQLLFFFKRKNIPIYYGTDSSTGLPDAKRAFIHNGKLTLPRPESEAGVSL